MMMIKIKVMVDNGHGITSDNGSPDGQLKEWRYCRNIAREVVKGLVSRGIDADLLVPEDTDIPLTTRAARVNKICGVYGAQNVVLVSIHLNAAGNGRQWMPARGWEAWTSPGQTRGDKLADSLYDAAQKLLPPGTAIRTDRTDGDRDKEARFTILTATRCPAALTENLFQDNRDDAAWLQTPAGRRAIVDIHVAGVIDYLKQIGAK